MKQPYAVELTQAAKDDIAAILDYSAEQFGDAARLRYELLIATALDDLRMDPMLPTSSARHELHQGARTYHLRHCRRRAAIEHGEVRSPRHVLVYVTPSPDLVSVLRLLHEAMDLDRHLPWQDDPPIDG